MTLLVHRGPRPSFGFRFYAHRQRYQVKGLPTRELAKEAEKRERQRVAQASFEARWGPVGPSLTPWKDVLNRYETTKATKVSLRLDLTRLRWWKTWAEARGIHYLQALTPELIEQAQRELTQADKRPATVKHYLAVLRHLYNLALRRWRVVHGNPVHAVTLPRVSVPPTRQLTGEEREKLLRLAPTWFRPLVLTALYTGLRQGAILALRGEDLRGRAGWIRVQGQKGGRDFFLPIAGPLRKILHPRPTDFLWMRDGQPLRRFPRETWDRLRQRSGLVGFRFHDLRHSVGTTLAEAGVPQRVIQAFLGHSTGLVTERYTKPTEAGLEGAIRALERAYTAPKRPHRVATRGKLRRSGRP